jgi:hypothetical protein
MTLIPRLPRRTHPSLLLGCLLPLLCSCANTSLKETWKAPDHTGGPAGKTAVLAVVDHGLLRQGVENRFVNQLGKGGQSAVTTFDLLTLTAAKEDKQAAVAKLQGAGAEAVLLVRVFDSATAYRQFRSGNERYAAVTTGFDTWGWYDYYTVAYMDLSTTYGSTKKKIVLDIGLFDLKTEKRLWSGMTQTVLEETTDGLAELDAVVSKVVGSMRADGMVR